MRNGFSLIQLSIILTVIAIGMAAVLPGGLKNGDAAKNQDTLEKMDRIEKAIVGWRTANGKYPCPADGGLPVADPHFGLAMEDTVKYGTCGGGSFRPADDNGLTVGGVVPTRTLGLTDDDMLDAWGRRFTYAVDTRVAVSDTIVKPDETVRVECGSKPPSEDVVPMEDPGGPRLEPYDPMVGNPRSPRGNPRGPSEPGLSEYAYHVTTSQPHGLQKGDKVTIKGGSGYDYSSGSNIASDDACVYVNGVRTVYAVPSENEFLVIPNENRATTGERWRLDRTGLSVRKGEHGQVILYPGNSMDVQTHQDTQRIDYIIPGGHGLDNGDSVYIWAPSTQDQYPPDPSYPDRPYYYINGDKTVVEATIEREVFTVSQTSPPVQEDRGFGVSDMFIMKNLGGSACAGLRSGSLKIVKPSGATDAFMALISHGANGHGAFVASGLGDRMNSGSSEPDELDNASMDSGGGNQFDSTFVQKDRTGGFDDIVHYTRSCP